MSTSRHHHGSHRGLLTAPSAAFPVDVDAIIVPTARGAATLKHAIELAEKLNCTLVVLSSKWSSARDVVALAGDRSKLIAIDIERLPSGVIPHFQTCEVLKDTQFERRTDLSFKRNLGLLIARLIGWERIFFLDDDISVSEPTNLMTAASLTDQFHAVGLKVDGMPDNSVVCHAYREAGGRQDTFVGGGAMAVGTRTGTMFFPNIYNEDWFFVLGDDGLWLTTITGTAIQEAYDPYREERARMEELGDVLAEGLFWLLDTGRSLLHADKAHWETFLRERAGFITDIMRMVEGTDRDPVLTRRMLAALKAARGRSKIITPELCVNYVKAWRADRATWRHHVEQTHDLVALPREDRRSIAGVRAMFRALGFHDDIAHLRLPSEPSHHDQADFDLPFPVGQ